MTYDIPRLLTLASAGKLRVPRFQRSFVWDASDVRRLFDSIYRGFPIGTLLLWRQDVPAQAVTFGSVEFNAPATTDALMVVDGQQRLTALVASLSPRNGPMDERFEVFFDLSRGRFVGLNRGMPPPRSIPVRETLESRNLLSWLREHGEDLEDSDLEVADALGGALRDYRVPAYIVEGNDERLLREVFDRVNSAGKPITRAQVFHALFANESEPGSPATVVAELRRIGFGEIPENRVVQSLLAMRGGDVQRDIHDEFSEDEDPADWYEQTERALDKSLRFLQGEGIVHQLLLPSSFPLPVLAAFFHLHSDPEPSIERLISRWLWRGWVHGFGREGGQTPALRRAVRSVNPRKKRPEEAPGEFAALKALLEPVRDQELTDLGIGNFRTDNANARLVLVALAALKPLSPTGESLDLGDVLGRFGADAIGDLVPKHRSRIGARGFWLREWPDLTGHEDSAILASHAVSPIAAAALRAGDIEAFLAERAKHVEAVTLNMVNSKLATGMRVRPPLNSLLVPDPEVAS
ncbi:hypothetical protein JNB_14983 [Janibacter sp. HTCC2649]|uniref:DUF262 domain-containing protein n=1 Tax=Janibacter sp. HTCC2649 TaxID=313589 RepID=UPI00006719EA|nr:DUF262 domain-containing protein [Janibacter sp. HTCC2649]EAP98279.1 hypothetical protein JNB_14983 [Janibacter sp. HTCC2649]